MNYRERQLRQIIKRDYVPKTDYQTLHFQHQQVLLDVDYQLQVNTKQENENLKKTVQALTLLANQRKQALEQEKSALITLAKQKLKNKKEAQALVEQIETN
jgi:murein endopeptidase